MADNQNPLTPENPHQRWPESTESVNSQNHPIKTSDEQVNDQTEQESLEKLLTKERYKPVNAGGNPFQTPANDGKVSDPDIDPRVVGEYSSSASRYDDFEDENDKGDSNNTDLGL